MSLEPQTIHRSVDKELYQPLGLAARLAATGAPLKVPGCIRERVCGPPIECALPPPAEDNGERRHGVAWPSEWASGHWEEDAA
jgi:hypothetical protein